MPDDAPAAAPHDALDRLRSLALTLDSDQLRWCADRWHEERRNAATTIRAQQGALDSMARDVNMADKEAHAFRERLLLEQRDALVQTLGDVVRGVRAGTIPEDALQRAEDRTRDLTPPPAPTVTLPGIISQERR